MRSLLTARQVQQILHIDRSTVYRMAEDGRLPSIKVGRQWRFPADRIRSLAAGAPAEPAAPGESTGPDPASAMGVIDVASQLLGVMMVVTDMSGDPVTPIVNRCPWFVQHGDDPDVMAACLDEWRQLADLDDFEPRFVPSSQGFECARAFIRSGSSLVGMVLVGGISPEGHPDSGLHNLDPAERDRVLAALPKLAASISRQAPRQGGAAFEEKK